MSVVDLESQRPQHEQIRGDKVEIKTSGGDIDSASGACHWAHSRNDTSSVRGR